MSAFFVDNKPFVVRTHPGARACHGLPQGTQLPPAHRVACFSPVHNENQGFPMAFGTRADAERAIAGLEAAGITGYEDVRDMFLRDGNLDAANKIMIEALAW